MYYISKSRFIFFSVALFILISFTSFGQDSGEVSWTENASLTIDQDGRLALQQSCNGGCYTNSINRLSPVDGGWVEFTIDELGNDYTIGIYEPGNTTTGIRPAFHIQADGGVYFVREDLSKAEINLDGPKPENGLNHTLRIEVVGDKVEFRVNGVKEWEENFNYNEAEAFIILNSGRSPSVIVGNGWSDLGNNANNPGLENHVEWENLDNLAVTSEGGLSKTNPSQEWDASASGVHYLKPGEDGWLEFTADEASNSDYKIGFSTSMLSNQIDYGITVNEQQGYAIDNGTEHLINGIVGTDLFRIERTDGILSVFEFSTSNGSVIYERISVVENNGALFVNAIVKSGETPPVFSNANSMRSDGGIETHIPIEWQDNDDRIDIVMDNRLYYHSTEGNGKLVPSQPVISAGGNGWIDFIWDNKEVEFIAGLQPVGSDWQFIEPKFLINSNGLNIKDGSGIVKTFPWNVYMGARCRLGKEGDLYYFFVNEKLEWIYSGEDDVTEVSAEFNGDVTGYSPIIKCFNTTGSVWPEPIDIIGENPSDTFSHFEGFESETSSWTNISTHLNISDDLDWTKLGDNTPSSSTGPSSAQEGNFFQYIEASGSGTGYPNKEAFLISPELSISEGWTEKEFRFWYHMYGSNIDKATLAIYMSIDGADWGSTPIYEIIGTSSNTWKEATVDLSQYQGQTIRLAIYGQTGDGYRSDIAVDNLSFEFFREEVISDFPYHEGFENENSVWVNDIIDDIDWRRYFGPTPTKNTGPDIASEGSAYMYVESSGDNNQNKRAALNSSVIDLTDKLNSTLSFDYNQWGVHSNKLVVRIQEKGSTGWVKVWEALGNRNNTWHNVVIDLSAYDSKEIKIRFNGNTGSGIRSDIAIDNINIYERPDTPVALDAQNITGEQFLASWNAVPEIQNYRLYVATDPEFLNYVSGYNGKVIAGTDETVTGLSPLTTYYYKVSAEDDQGLMSVDSNDILLVTIKGSDVPSGAMILPYQDGWSSGVDAYDFINITPTLPQSTCEDNAYNQWHYLIPQNSAFKLIVSANFYPLNLTIWRESDDGTLIQMECIQNLESGLIETIQSNLHIGEKYFVSISSEIINAGNYGITIETPMNFWSRADGDWSDTNTWSKNEGGNSASRTPGNMDTVHISGHTVDLLGDQGSGDITIHVVNDKSNLAVKNNSVLTVHGSVKIMNKGGTSKGLIIDATSELHCVEP